MLTSIKTSGLDLSISFNEFHKSKAVQAELSVLLEVIIQQFLVSWYIPLIALNPTDSLKSPSNRAVGFHPKIRKLLYALDKPLTSSQSSKFIEIVEFSIKYSLLELKKRITSIEDWIPLISNKFLPLLTKHLAEFKKASHKISQKGKRTLTQSDELNQMIASLFKGGKLHPAIASSVLVSNSTRDSELFYLRKVVESILPYLMPPSEFKSRMVCSLIIEIIITNILQPLMDLLTEPDYWNQWLDLSATEAIQEQRMVHKLREALEKPFEGKDSNHPPSFEEYLLKIDNCSNLVEARKIRNTLVTELSKRKAQIRLGDLSSTSSSSLLRYTNRLVVAIKKIDSKITQLGGAQNVLLKENMMEPVQLKFESFLQEPGLSYFQEFMDKNHSLQILQFFVTAETLLKPYFNLISSEEDRNDFFIYIREKEQLETLSSDLQLLLSKFEPTITEHFPEFIKAISSTLGKFQDFGDLGCLYDCLAYVKSLKQKTFDMMETNFYNKFCLSDYYFSFMSTYETTIKRSSSSRSSQSRRNSKYNFFETVESAQRQDNTKNRNMLKNLKGIANLTLKVVKGPLSAGKEFFFNSNSGNVSSGAHQETSNPVKLVSAEPSMESSSPDASTSSISHQDKVIENSDDCRSSLLNADAESFISMMDESVVPEEKIKLVEEALQNIINEKAPAEALTYDSDVSDIAEDESSETTNLKDHNLNEDEIEEEEKFDKDYEIQEKNSVKLEYESVLSQLEKNEQHQLLLEMMQKKNQQTSIRQHQKEMKLLNKMKWQYDQERMSLLTRKSQLELQLSDNFIIHNESKITIPSWAVNTEDSTKKAFIVYVIQVEQKVAGHNWIIARRYNEFHELNRVLRSIYPTLMNGVDFPGKRFHLSSIKGETDRRELEFREERRLGLQKYLSTISKNDIICRSPEFRSFLCSDQIFESKGNGFTLGLNNLKDIPRDILKVLRGNIMKFGENKNRAQQNSTEEPIDTLEELKLSPNELEFSTETISRLIVELFDLHEIWWRRQATTWIIQEVIGGQLERKIYEFVENLFSEENLVSILSQWRETLSLPYGIPPRTTSQKNHTRLNVYRKLHILIPDLVGSVVGRSNAKRGSTRVFEVLQNKNLNQELLYQYFDLLINSLFEEQK